MSTEDGAHDRLPMLLGRWELIEGHPNFVPAPANPERLRTYFPMALLMDLHFSKSFPELKSMFNKHSHTALKYCDLGINLIRTFDKSIRRILRNP